MWLSVAALPPYPNAATQRLRRRYAAFFEKTPAKTLYHVFDCLGRANGSPFWGTFHKRRSSDRGKISTLKEKKTPVLHRG
jgi:hypothetical protein